LAQYQRLLYSKFCFFIKLSAYFGLNTSFKNHYSNSFM